jgi:hypothetical protein
VNTIEQPLEAGGSEWGIQLNSANMPWILAEQGFDPHLQDPKVPIQEIVNQLRRILAGEIGQITTVLVDVLTIRVLENEVAP